MDRESDYLDEDDAQVNCSIPLYKSPMIWDVLSGVPASRLWYTLRVINKNEVEVRAR